MQETEKTIDKKVLDFINKLNLSYNIEKDILYINGQETNEYSNKVIIAQIKRQCNKDIDIETIKKVLSDKGSFTVKEEDKELTDLFDLVDKDNNINESEWKEYLKWKRDEALWKIDKDGLKTGLMECILNIIGFIEHFPKLKNKIKFNKIRNIVEYDGRQVLDSDYHMIIDLINRYFIPQYSNLKMIKEAVDNIGFKNQYNRWVNYFNELKYENDGTDYIDYTIKNVLCCEEQEKYYDLYYETLKLMLLASMSRIYNKELKGIPTKYDTVVALCGKNGGSGKTTFFERLYDIDDNGNSYCYVCAGDSFDPKNKDFIERTHQNVCLFLDEVSMKRSIVTSVKGYITQKDDKFRKSYGFNNESHMRNFIIVASSNNDDILKDYTTNNERRWAIIKISENEKNYENVNKAFDNGYRDKLWAFIKNIYKNEQFNLYFTDERIIKLEEEIQRGYKASNNDDYNTIINDLLEREYGFVSIHGEEYIDIDYIIKQYQYGDSKKWCENHNLEWNEKYSKSLKGEYIMKPEDRLIETYGKINAIRKTDLYAILSRLNMDYTKPTLRSEIEYSKRWNGYLKDHDVYKINGLSQRAYWRKNLCGRTKFNQNGNNSDTLLPF